MPPTLLLSSLRHSVKPLHTFSTSYRKPSARFHGGAVLSTVALYCSMTARDDPTSRGRSLLYATTEEDIARNNDALLRPSALKQPFNPSNQLQNSSLGEETNANREDYLLGQVHQHVQSSTRLNSNIIFCQPRYLLWKLDNKTSA
jgi:hypothetical protein